MTAKRDSKRKHQERKPSQPKVKKETVRDLEVKDKAQDVKGGFKSYTCCV